MKRFATGDAVEFCLVTRNTGAARWYPAIYYKPTDPHVVPGSRPWHLLREPNGNIVLVPMRRVRAAAKAIEFDFVEACRDHAAELAGR